MILSIVALILFGYRGWQWRRVFEKQGVNLSGLSFFFSKEEETSEYRREVWLETVVVLLCFVSGASLDLLQSHIDSSLVLTIWLLWPLSLLFYAFMSKDFEQITRSTLKENALVNGYKEKGNSYDE